MAFIVAAGFGLEFAMNYLLTHNMTLTEYGDYKVIEAFCRMGGSLIILGGGRGALYFLPRWRDQNRYDLVWTYIRFYLDIAIYIAVVIIVCLAVVQFSLQALGIDAGIYGGHAILIAAMSLPAVGLALLNTKVLQAFGKATAGLGLQWIFLPAVVILFLLLVRYFQGHISVTDAIISILLALILKLTIQVLYLYGLGVKPVKSDRKYSNRKEWLAFSIPVMIATLIQQMMIRTDIFMLEAMGDEKDVGLLGVCSLITSVLLIIKLPIASTTTHHMARAYKEGTERMNILSASGNRLIVVFCLPLSLIVVFFSTEVLASFGQDYVEAELALQILMTGYVAQTLLMFPMIWLQYTGKKNQALAIMTFTALLNILLNAIFIPIWQLNGAAAGTTVSLVTGAILSAVLMWKHLKIAPWSLRAPG